MKINKRTAAVLSAAVICTGAFFACRTGSPVPEKEIRLESEYALEAWLNIKGWKVSSPIHTIITVPREFSGIYAEYALMQQRLGLPVDRYKGQKADRYLFTVENYGGEVPVTAELLVKDDILIGAALFENKPSGRILSP